MHDAIAGYVCMNMMKSYDKNHPELHDEDEWWRAGVLKILHEDKKRNLPYGGTYGDLLDAMDTQLALTMLDLHWKDIFSKLLPRTFYNWVKELNSVRNDCAHPNMKDFTDDYTVRALDTMARICEKMDEDVAADIRALGREIEYGSKAGSIAAAPQKIDTYEVKKSDAEGILRNDTGYLKSWREVMQPHPDVQKGQYQNAEFAADLAQVARGEGSREYIDPVEFFNRTYITEGMKGLLTTALKRITGIGGEPVIQLKTSFGGGKTHSMLALYHLFKGQLRDGEVTSIDELIAEAGLNRLPQRNAVHVAVLVGTALDPTTWKRPIDLPGITIHTLWGEMAAQLMKSTGNAAIYDYVKEADKKGISPGSEKLKQMFDACGSCVILIDELVAYARKLYGAEDKNLPAGTFANVLSFIQEITEAAKASNRSIVIASIPESDIEIGGAAGQEALVQIEHTFGRVESIWKPVTPAESFEVVRRRLFLPCQDEKAREEICDAFSIMYRGNGTAFPVEAKEPGYQQRMLECYPIHPEIFDDLYDEWGTIDRFQKTRGVLRLMAGVVYQLWTNGDSSCMIMPSSIPLHITQVHDELVRYLPDNWNSIIDSEIDGAHSEAVKIDTHTRFNRVLAARRVARTIFLATAPGTREQNIRGIDESRIRLGTVLPNESKDIPVFNDAIQKLKATLSYLYSNEMGTMLWFDNRPTLRKLVADQEQRVHKDEIEMEIEGRILKWRCSNLSVHILPKSSSDVPDEQTASLVVLPLKAVHSKELQSAAMGEALDILEHRGNTGRIHKNMLVFLAPDKNKLHHLEQTTRRYLAWKMIHEEAEQRNLDQNQLREANNSIAQVERDLKMKLTQCYEWLLVPFIEVDNLRVVQWDIYNLSCSNQDNLTKARERLVSEEDIIESWAPALLKMRLDEIIWKDRDDITCKELWDCLTNYCYLPRLINNTVLHETIMQGVRQGVFALAEAKQDDKYLGITLGQDYFGMLAPSTWLVKREIAEAQLREEQEAADTDNGTDGDTDSQEDLSSQNGVHEGGGTSTGGDKGTDTTEPSRPKSPQHFAMDVSLDETRINKQVNDYVTEILQHLMNVKGASVNIRLDIDVDLPEGTPEHVVRTVSENCQTLKVQNFHFE
ncbi:MAG: DUF499 domain-containing protein [Selenomonas sp.]|nr:DUF499 domain-containing protein [Selenomonas sp.]